MNFQQLFLVMEKLKLGESMVTLLVELLTRVCSNCVYNSGIIRQSSFFLVTFLKKFNNSCQVEVCINFWPYCELLERSRKKSRKYFQDIIIDLNQDVWMNEKVAPDAATSHYVDTPQLLSRIISVIILCSIISQK